MKSSAPTTKHTGQLDFSDSFTIYVISLSLSPVTPPLDSWQLIFFQFSVRFSVPCLLQQQVFSLSLHLLILCYKNESITRNHREQFRCLFRRHRRLSVFPVEARRKIKKKGKIKSLRQSLDPAFSTFPNLPLLSFSTVSTSKIYQ